MLKMLTAVTEEIDEVQVAVEEILSQLHLDTDLMANAVGILTCYTEFIDSGVVRAVCDAMPFPVVGHTTLANGTNAASGTLQLSLTVLTGDDVSFATAQSVPLRDERILSGVRDVWATATAALSEAPKLVLAYLPLMPDVPGEMIAQELFACAGDVPVFGALACDHTTDFELSQTVYDGDVSPQAMSLILVAGNVSPRFVVASVSEDKIQRHRAIITDSEGCLLRTVNDMSVADYMGTLGLTEEFEVDAARSLPLFIDYGDGTKPVARAVLLMTEEGYAMCCGFIPESASFAVGTIDYAEVMRSTEQAMREVLAMDNMRAVLVHACVVRNYTIGSDVLGEMNLVRKLTGDKIPLSASYAGGELCPMFGADGQMFNRFHNYTIVACVL